MQDCPLTDVFWARVGDVAQRSLLVQLNVLDNSPLIPLDKFMGPPEAFAGLKGTNLF